MDHRAHERESGTAYGKRTYQCCDVLTPVSFHLHRIHMGHMTGRQAGKHSGNHHRTLEESGCPEPTESIRSSAAELARVCSQHTWLKEEQEYRDGVGHSCKTLNKAQVPGTVWQALSDPW